MLAEMKARRKDDRGFTLIELMVVVLIIGILIAIAIPSFFNAREAADKAAVRSNLRNALTAAKTWYAQNNAYTGFVIGDITKGGEPALADAGVTTTSVAAQTIAFSDTSGSITCTLAEDASAGTVTWGGDCAAAP